MDATLNDIRGIVEAELIPVSQITQRFPIHTVPAYSRWLAQTYYYVAHSTRLLALASSRFPHDSDALHYRFAEHIREEKGHDNLALRDLKAIGGRIEDYPEYPETQAFYQTQYYWIEHQDPIALFGYILALETFSTGAGTRLYDQAKAAHGHDATIFLKVHTQEDIEHVEKAIRSLEGITPRQLAMVISNLKLSCHHYRTIYERIIAETKDMA